MSTPTTEVYWDIDGIPLQTLAYNITTLGGGRMAPPAFRGSDAVIPGRPGSVFQARVPDSRTIELAMWVQGSREDGSAPLPGTNLRQQFDANWRKLVQLLWTGRKQKTLTKRFYIPKSAITDAGLDLADFQVSGNWVIISASAKFSYSGGLSPTLDSPGHGAFTVDLFLSDPYFYGPTVTTTFNVNDATSAQTLNVLGDDRTTAIALHLVGPLTAARMTNLDADTALYVEFGTEVAQGETADLDVATFGAIHTPTSGPYPAPGYVNHVGDIFWLYLDPGPQRLALTAQSGTGSATFTYTSVWL